VSSDAGKDITVRHKEAGGKGRKGEREKERKRETIIKR
jgi:hypothetical protein